MKPVADFTKKIQGSFLTHFFFEFANSWLS